MRSVKAETRIQSPLMSGSRALLICQRSLPLAILTWGRSLKGITLHYYQFNIGDYRKKTGHLTLVEHSIYRALIDTYYLTENPLELDTNKLMRSHSVRTIEEKEAFINVLEEFFIKTSDGYKHENCDSQLGKIYDKSAKAKASAKARWAKKDADNMRTHSERIETPCERIENGCELDATHYPLPINPLPTIKTLDQDELDREFEKVWEMYGRKGNKKTSKARFVKLKVDDKNLMYNHLPAYLLSTPDKQYRKDFQSYINLECWNDEVISNENSKGSYQPRLSAVEEVQRAIAERQAARQASNGRNGEIMDADVGDIRAGICEPVRIGTHGELGEAIDGDFTTADSEGA